MPKKNRTGKKGPGQGASYSGKAAADKVKIKPLLKKFAQLGRVGLQEFLELDNVKLDKNQRIYLRTAAGVLNSELDPLLVVLFASYAPECGGLDEGSIKDRYRDCLCLLLGIYNEKDDVRMSLLVRVMRAADTLFQLSDYADLICMEDKNDFANMLMTVLTASHVYQNLLLLQHYFRKALDDSEIAKFCPKADNLQEFIWDATKIDESPLLLAAWFNFEVISHNKGAFKGKALYRITVKGVYEAKMFIFSQSLLPYIIAAMFGAGGKEARQLLEEGNSPQVIAEIVTHEVCPSGECSKSSAPTVFNFGEFMKDCCSDAKGKMHNSYGEGGCGIFSGESRDGLTDNQLKMAREADSYYRGLVSRKNIK